ncbi:MULTISPECIES: excisionase family DNA-binding protein [Rhodomicrobium]|uniref:excisionase family DNA-binding protein n=1 Tax=Rhodomicrobium TaxID=1068 RepID=UPI000B4A7AD6|nr:MULTISPECIES: excisionase family DNA-binding protein [Rhodomicrobium]
MTDREREVLTTSQAAKLLGISVRTAQLLVEGGTLRSWKTPGGHRRIDRADVLALMDQPAPAEASASALVLVLASPERLSSYDALSAVGGYSLETHSELYSASVAIGSGLPAAVIIDLRDEGAERLAFGSHLAANPALGHTRVILVGGPDAAARGLTRVPSPEALPALLRGMQKQDAAAWTGEPPPYPLAANEGQRLAALERSGLVDTAPEKAFDRLTWLAGHVLEAPVALMTLLTPTRQWFKSRQGLELTETPRSWAFCNRTILQRDMYAVEDLARDREFADNPAVAGGPNFRFYAGAPVVDPDGFALGSICVLDYAPRRLDDERAQTLLALAALASDEVRLRATDRQLRWALKALNRQPRH